VLYLRCGNNWLYSTFLFIIVQNRGAVLNNGLHFEFSHNHKNLLLLLHLKKWNISLLIVFIVLVSTVNGDSFMIGDVYVDGQNRNVWCNSKKAIIDDTMYKHKVALIQPIYATKPSCYVMEKATRMVLLILSGKQCSASDPLPFSHYILCA
jgi:hypothetical protein